jgi:hypothetical protein
VDLPLPVPGSEAPPAPHAARMYTGARPDPLDPEIFYPAASASRGSFTPRPVASAGRRRWRSSSWQRPLASVFARRTAAAVMQLSVDRPRPPSVGARDRRKARICSSSALSAMLQALMSWRLRSVAHLRPPRPAPGPDLAFRPPNDVRDRPASPALRARSPRRRVHQGQSVIRKLLSPVSGARAQAPDHLVRIQSGFVPSVSIGDGEQLTYIAASI